MVNWQRHIDLVDGLFSRIRMPREFKASFELIHSGTDEWIEMNFPNGERWKLTLTQVRKGKAP